MPSVKRTKISSETGIFIVGTDTGVGKTYVGVHLAKILKKKGVDVGVFKPFESGTGVGHEDYRLLMEAAGVSDEEKTVCPYALRAPLAPKIAAQKEGIVIDWSHLEKAFQKIRARHQFVIVEGAGGLLVPLHENKTNLDLIRMCSLPVLMIGRLGLGTLNHCALTHTVLKQNPVPCMGILLNQGVCETDLSCESNVSILEEMCGVPVTALKQGEDLSSLPATSHIARLVEIVSRKERSRIK